jgi:small-conductance mechanosensitive channel
MHKRDFRYRPNQLLLWTAWYFLAFGLVATPAEAQVLAQPKATESSEESWQPPDLAELPSDWWTQLVDDDGVVPGQRFNPFLGALEQRIQALGGNELVTAQNGVDYIRSQMELLALTEQGPLDQQFTPPLAKESYFLDELLSLRGQLRKLAASTTQLELQIEQSERRISLLQNRRDKLLREYLSTNPESPTRLHAGINRVSARVEYELARKTAENLRESLKQIKPQHQLISEQLAFALDHLVDNDATLADLRKEEEEAIARESDTARKVAALQPQLLNVLSAESVNLSLQVLRQQQLTRASAESELAQLQKMLVTAKSSWYQFRAGVLDPGFDLQSATTQTRLFTREALKQVELWSTASQSTLMTRPSDTDLNTVKNFEIAQSVARDTLAALDQIRSTVDDLLFIQQTLTSEFISAQSGISNTGARLSLAFSNTLDRVIEISDFHLFDIGETPVTPAGLIKMLLILGLAIGISWLIRHLLARGIRRKQTVQSPAFYALGRILHYIIIIAGSFAALGSIGIDFTSFALIAGALSVGIGFGLQAIVSNFVSGLILLFEGTLRVGDFIELDNNLRGSVKEINTRATVITTNDSVDVVVPNSVLVTTQLTNWTLRETFGRIRVSFGVAYGSDKELVKTIALEAVKKVDCALTHMPDLEPQVRLVNFGDNSLDFTVLFWVSRQGVRRPGRTRANFMWELDTLLVENGVEIPFPQRDLHVKSDFRVQQNPVHEPNPTDE